jgi:predicted nucleic acid-binding protein
VDTQSDALRLAERLGYAIFDALIGVDCHTLWSKDKQHGAGVDGRLRIANPF